MTPNVYITESGTNGIWKYHKYSDGTYHAWYEGPINLLAGSALGGGFYHTSSSGANPPSFSRSVTSMSGANCSATILAYVGVNVTNYQTYWWNGAANAVNNIPVRLDMYGTW